MTGPPSRPDQPPMRDELEDAWNAYHELLARANMLEEIAERLAATCVDPVAVADWRTWKVDGS